MLRLALVCMILLAGTFYAVQGPFYALLFYLWYAYFRPDWWVWSSIIMRLNLSLIIGAFLILSSVLNLRDLRWTGQVFLILLFFAQATLSLTTTVNMDYSLEHWIEFAKVVVVTVLIVMLVTDAKRYRLTLLVIAYSLGFEAAKQGWAQLLLNPGGTNNNRMAMFGDNNDVALGMVMLVPIFVALAQTATSQWEKYLHRFFIIGVLYRAVSTYSRGGILSLAALALLVLWRSPHKLRAIVVTAVLAAALSSVMPQRFWDRMNTITAAPEERDASARGRLHFWNVALEMAADSPITGVGFNAYRYAYPTYDPSSGQFGAIRAVHSSWFGTLAETGYPGLALIILNIATALLTCRRIRAESLRSGRRDLAFYAQNLQTSLFAFTIGGSFLSMHYNEMLWHLVGLSAALNLIHRQAVKETAPAPVPVSRPISIPVPASRPAAIAARQAPAARPGPSSPARSVRR